MAIQDSVVIRQKKEARVGKWEMFKDTPPPNMKWIGISQETEIKEEQIESNPASGLNQPYNGFHFWIPELNAP